MPTKVKLLFHSRLEEGHIGFWGRIGILINFFLSTTEEDQRSQACLLHLIKISPLA